MTKTAAPAANYWLHRNAVAIPGTTRTTWQWSWYAYPVGSATGGHGLDLASKAEARAAAREFLIERGEQPVEGSR